MAGGGRAAGGAPGEVSTALVGRGAARVRAACRARARPGHARRGPQGRRAAPGRRGDRGLPRGDRGGAPAPAGRTATDLLERASRLDHQLGAALQAGKVEAVHGLRQRCPGPRGQPAPPPARGAGHGPHRLARRLRAHEPVQPRRRHGLRGQGDGQAAGLRSARRDHETPGRAGRRHRPAGQCHHRRHRGPARWHAAHGHGGRPARAAGGGAPQDRRRRAALVRYRRGHIPAARRRGGGGGPGPRWSGRVHAQRGDRERPVPHAGLSVPDCRAFELRQLRRPARRRRRQLPRHRNGPDRARHRAWPDRAPAATHPLDAGSQLGRGNGGQGRPDQRFL